MSQNSHLILVISDFKARSLFWWENDLTTREGSQDITSSYGLSQLIHKPTLILENYFWCIDLIFINRDNSIMNSAVQVSLHRNCHHQVVYIN